MKKQTIISLVAMLAFCCCQMPVNSQESYKVSVQPVKGVHTVVIEDAVTLKVYVDKERGTELEVGSNEQVARVSKGVMTMDGSTKAVLRLAPDSPICHFEVKDVASLELIGPVDFGDNQFTVDAVDAGRVKLSKTLDADTVKAGYVILHTQDNARIVSDMPLLLTAYTFHAEDASRIEMPSAVVKHGVTTDNKTYEIVVSESGKVVVNDRGDGEERVVSRRPSEDHDGLKSRDMEFIWFWGFNNWGSKPFSGFGGADGAAALKYYFMNFGLSFDYPIVDTRHFGFYAGLGLEGNFLRFDNDLVNYTPTGFSVGTTSSVVQPVSGTFEPDNWTTNFNMLAFTVPLTFSFEPWKYDGFCVRLSAIPGVNASSYLQQVYENKTTSVTVNDKRCRKQVRPFMLDARLTLMYGDIGLYAQVATLPLFKQGFEPLYPVKFGIYWSLAGR